MNLYQLFYRYNRLNIVKTKQKEIKTLDKPKIDECLKYCIYYTLIGSLFPTYPSMVNSFVPQRNIYTYI